VAKLAARTLEMYGAKEAVQKLGHTRVDPIELAGRAGVFVMLRPLDRLVGAFLREERPGIILNSERPVGMIHMTCAHELGHFFLGHLSTADEHLVYGDQDSAMEQEAEHFAHALLAPAWLLADVINRYQWGGLLADPVTLYQLSLRLGLSFEATVWSLARHKLLNPRMATELSKIEPISIKRHIVPEGFQVQSLQDVWILSEVDKGAILEPRPSDAVFLNLPSRMSAGLMWTVEDGAANYRLQPVGIRQSPVPADVRDIVAGSTGRAQYQLELKGGGDRKLFLRLAERPPWDHSAPIARKIELETALEAMDVGLSDGSIELHMSEAAQ
jgi:Zn-dependent peptidase ImmA (M78 family)